MGGGAIPDSSVVGCSCHCSDSESGRDGEVRALDLVQMIM